MNDTGHSNASYETNSDNRIALYRAKKTYKLLNFIILFLFFGALRADRTLRARCTRRAAGCWVWEEGHVEARQPQFFRV